MLLFWAQSLQPEGRSGIAAIRFGQAVVIESIRIVPSGVSAFVGSKQVLGKTLPWSFDTNVFLNFQGHSLGGATNQPKLPPNTLASTNLVYDGELLDHSVDMEDGYSTRLLIFQGGFEQMSIGVYGRLASSETSVRPATLHQPPRLFPTNHPRAFANPIAPAEQILARATAPYHSITSIVASYFNAEAEEQKPPVKESESDSGAPSAEDILVQHIFKNGAENIQDGQKHDAIAIAALFSLVWWSVENQRSDTTVTALFLLKTWLSNYDVRKVASDLSLVSQTYLEPLLRCCTLSDNRASSTTRGILRTALHKPADLFTAYRLISSDDQLTLILPLDTPTIRNVLLEVDNRSTIELVSSFDASHLGKYVHAYTMRLALARASDSLRYESEERGRLLGDVREITGQALPYLVLDKLAQITEALPSVASSIGLSGSIEGAIEAFGVCNELVELLRNCLDWIPTTSRIGEQIAKAAAVIPSCALAAAQSRPSQEELSDLAEESSSRFRTVFITAYKRLADAKDNTSAMIKSILIEADLSETKGIVPYDVISDLLEAILSNSSGLSRSSLIQDCLAVLPDLHYAVTTFNPDAQTRTVSLLVELDEGEAEIGDWILQREIATLEKNLDRLAEIRADISEDTEVLRQLLLRSVDKTFSFLSSLFDCQVAAQVLDFLASNSQTSLSIGRCLQLMADESISSIGAFEVSRILSSSRTPLERPLMTSLVFTLLRSVRTTSPPFGASIALSQSLFLLETITDEFPMVGSDLARLRSEFGYALTELAADEGMQHWGDELTTAQTIVSILDLLRQQQPSNDNGSLLQLDGLSEFSFQRLTELADRVLPPDARQLSSFTPYIQWSDALPKPLSAPISWKTPLNSTASQLEFALQAQATSRATTPPPPSTPPTILGMAALSPFTVLRSPTTRVASLTKTYLNNDFRQQRTSPNMNTSRPPSMHVDDFQVSSSPPGPANILQPSPVAPHIPSWQSDSMQWH